MKIAVGLREYHFMLVTKRTTVTFGMALKIHAAAGESMVFRSGSLVTQATTSKCCAHWFAMKMRVSLVPKN